MKVIFETPGQLDVRAITTFGINAKPNTHSPIGFFGTGLKYAIAVLLREGCRVAVFTNKTRYEFSVQKDLFREKEFEFIAMERKTILGTKSERMPFTTELGKKWKLWQAFRELYSNTLDENGECYLGEAIHGEPLKTYIVVEGAAFVEEYERRFSHTFVEEGLAMRGVTRGVQILPRESKCVYYRGVRIMELQKPSLYTYNVLDSIDLTEDRTAKYPFQLEAHIRDALCSQEDRKVLERVLNADELHWENSFDFEGMWQTLSPEFIMVGEHSSNRSVRKLIRSKDENWIALQQAKHFTERLAECITEGEWDKFKDIAEENQDELFKLLMGLRPSSWEPDADMITVEEEDATV